MNSGIDSQKLEVMLKLLTVERFCLEARAANFSRADAVQIAQQGSPHRSPELPKLLKQHLR